jgi:hypothetical protein
LFSENNGANGGFVKSAPGKQPFEATFPDFLSLETILCTTGQSGQQQCDLMSPWKYKFLDFNASHHRNIKFQISMDVTIYI